MDDLTQVPEVRFQRAPETGPSASSRAATPEAKRQRIENRNDAMKQTAHVLARINHLNKEGADHFLHTLRQQRPDLDGLPFIMGDACRMSRAMSKAFAFSVEAVHAVRDKHEPGARPATHGADKAAEGFWGNYRLVLSRHGEMPSDRAARVTAAQITALMQMLAPEDAAMRRGLVKYHLAAVDTGDATRALARLAIFAPEAEVRAEALGALKNRRKSEANERLVADVLLAGLRYPWPAVMQHAGEAVARLGRTDLVPQLAALLDEPDPRAPAAVALHGKKTLAVRELVRVNHLRNCLLCHAPGNTPDVIDDKGFGFANGTVVTGPVPTPGHALAPPSRGSGYGPSESPDILVRADVTYLRQDFSRMQSVTDAAPWPDMQRFDFLVRTRVVTEKDAAAYQTWLKQQGPRYVAPHRQAALTALRTLTGRDAAPTAQAWRAVLGD